MMNDIIASGTIQTLKSIFQKKPEHNVIIDPFSCLVKLSLLRFLESGTKISINNNRLFFNSPTYIQGIVRFLYGDNREHLHNLYLPIQKCVEWFWDEKHTDMIYIFNNAVIGLKILKKAYSEYATIQHTIDYYIIILMQKNSTLIAKMGITTLDIDTITSNLLDTNTSDKNKQHKSQKKEQQSKEQQTKEQQSKEQQSREDQQKVQLLKEEQSKIQPSEYSVDTINKLKDIHKFLFELWNKREIDIVINLYKELESKKNTDEQNSLYDNIMNYCSMKETKLNKYIEQNSSVL
jgi:hypothetical protein